jgi:hypothetical protein
MRNLNQVQQPIEESLWLVHTVELWTHIVCRNPNLGLTTKAFSKVRSRLSLGVTFHAPMNAKECEGMNPHTPK